MTQANNRLCLCVQCHCNQLSDPATEPTEAEKLIAQGHPPQPHSKYTSDTAKQDAYWRHFGYAVLNRPTVEFLRKFNPIVEAGAGTGYWAWELQQAGLDVIATDPCPADRFPDATPWTKVLPLKGPEAVKAHPDRNLLLCWPEREGVWPQETLAAFTGKHLLYVGEEREGCTGTYEMFDTLEDLFTLDQVHEIPRFAGNNDYLFIYTRNT